MSNLVKQYYVVEPENKKRIINNNQLIKDKLEQYEKETEFKSGLFFPGLSGENVGKAEIDETQNEPDDMETVSDSNEEEFVDGIEAAVVETTDTDSTVEQILQRANEKADDIIEVANKNADVIIQKAKENAELIYEEKRKEGYEAGSIQKEQEIEQLKEQLEEEYLQKKQELELEVESYTSQLETDLIDALTQVFDKVFRIQFDDKKEMLLHLVKNTISKIEVGREFRIHVSQSNYKFILSHIDEIRERIGNDVEIEIVNDANLDSSDCQIETSFGVFDCGIDMELNNLIKDIKSLCS